MFPTKDQEFDKNYCCLAAIPVRKHNIWVLSEKKLQTGQSPITESINSKGARHLE